MTLVPILGYGAMVAYLATLITKYYLSRRHFTKHPETPADTDCVVTVLQPILSGDPLLESTLRTNLQTTTTESVRFLFLIDEDDPEAQSIAETLHREFPLLVESVLCPPVLGDLNPKAVKLQYALPRVSSDVVAVLDDDTWLPNDNLSVAIQQLQLNDLYTGLPCYLATKGIWSSLTAHFVNNNSIMTYLPLLSYTEPLSINGMFYVLRTESLQRIGGWQTLEDQLCDDYAMAQLVRSSGLTIRQGTTPQFLHSTVESFAAYFQLMHRWFLFANVLVADQSVAMKVVLFLFLGTPPLLLWMAMLSLSAGWFGAAVLAAALVVRHLLIRDLLRRVCGSKPRLNWFVSLCAELLQPIHWLHAVLRRDIRWRSRQIRLCSEGRFTYLE